ncbi:MAG: glycosyltransferase family 8 protein [Opitutales bacterium]|nr:glycosyltransferase family 8 protein [Opitutales bacterium]
MNTYDICFAPDENYARCCAAAVVSISDNAKAGETFVFHILHNAELSQKSLQMLQTLKSKKDNFSVKLHLVGDEEFRGFPDYGHQPVWYRFKIPQLIQAKKVLYLDCDVIANASLADLFAEDLNGFALAAVKDNIYKKLGKKYKLPKNQPYFNSGVCLINCEYWRKNDLCGQFFDYIKQDPNRAWLLDQNILNILFGAKTKIINLKYNFQYVPRFAFESCYFADLRQYKEALKNPVIIHFFGEVKPWVAGLGALHPMQEKFITYLQQTPWKMQPDELRDFRLKNRKGKFAARLKLYFRAVKRNPQFLFKPYFWSRTLM